MTDFSQQKQWAIAVVGSDFPQPSGFDKFEVDDGVTVLVDFTTHKLFFVTDETLPAETLNHYFEDLVRPKLLARDGQLVLHAGAVFGARGAICFVGDSGAGKSTLVASLHTAGWPIISDDALFLARQEQGFTVERLYPSLRLFPDSIANVAPMAGDTSVMAHYSTKRRVAFAEGPQTAPLAAIFRLRDPGGDDAILSRQLKPSDACMAILANSFAFDPGDRAEARQRLSRVAEVVRLVPVFDLCYPRIYTALPKVHASIRVALDQMTRSRPD